MVGVQGFEPWTPCSQSRCATRLRYTPTEPIFYTERAIAGKSCKIRNMIAYFSSKIVRTLQSAFALGLLIFCLLGTHWIGLTHSISHAQSSQIIAPSASDQHSMLTHDSARCHLFDALSLASFIAPSDSAAVIYAHFNETYVQYGHSVANGRPPALYQSRAPPPSFIL